MQFQLTGNMWPKNHHFSKISQPIDRSQHTLLSIYLNFRDQDAFNRKVDKHDASLGEVPG